MKKQTRESTRLTGRRERSKRKPAPNNIAFGIFQNKNGRDVVVIKNTEFSVIEIHPSVKVPILPNSSVKVRLTQSQTRDNKNVVVLRVFGPRLTIKERIAQLLKDSKIPIEFPSNAATESKKFGQKIVAKDKQKRLDLTKLALCTIDGESAKDFDDAVYAGKKGKNIEVVVAIADVSHYVKENTGLDEEAISRGTSVYFPGSCVPMLPENLSNGLCSLKPDMERLAIAVSFELGPKGGLLRTRVSEAVIKSKARLTYNQVQNFYDQKSDTTDIPVKIKNSLTWLQKAAHILRKNRKKRGAIDFDLIETLVALDDEGEPIAIHPQDRLDSHRIIEDLMVATNEIIAELFENKRWPCLYRVHEAPDKEKLENFFKTAHAFGVLDKSVKTKAENVTEPKALQEIMTHYQKSKYQETLNTLMLRSMMQARYSEQNLMHFGLASTAYVHFTSPIRRYADLIVHRQLRYLLFEKNYRKKITERALAQIAQGISEKEIRATDLERKIDRLYSATFMSSRIGEIFEANIVSCTEFGFFVRIAEHHVEGLVHISTISRHHVNFLPEKLALVVTGSNKTFMVGDRVMVRLVNVSVDRGHVDFELARSN